MESERAAAEARARPQWVGKIMLVNESERFVLIEAGQWRGKSGTLLESSRQGKKSGGLRASEVQKRPFVVADIVQGDPARGDEVWQRPAPAGTTPPSATPADQNTPPPATAPWWRRLFSGFRR